MAGEYLRVKEEGHICRIAWFLPDDDDYGMTLGESRDDGAGEPPEDRDEWETWAACKAIATMVPEPERDRGGWYWDDLRAARNALRVAKEAMKHDRPLPEWAQTAFAAGWKPPKGWKA